MHKPSSQSTPIAPSPPKPPRLNLFLALMAIAFTVAVVIVASWQPPYPYPAKPFAERNLVAQIIYPIEANGDLRLWQPTLTLNSIAASSNGMFVIAVGNNGAALFSDNGGRQWRNLTTGVDEHLTYAWISDDGSKGGAVTFSGLKYEMTPNSSVWELELDKSSSGKPVFSAQNSAKSKDTIAYESSEIQLKFFNNRSPDWPNGMPAGTQIERFTSRDISDKSSDTPVRMVVSKISPDCKQAWAIGDFGSIVTSNERECGKSWELQASALPGSLSTVTFLNDGKRGWAAGYGGSLLRTVDGGDHWIPISMGTHTTFTSVYFIENGSGWVVGEDGTLMLSLDFGLSWIPVDVQPKLKNPRCVHFLSDGLQGRIVNEDGSFMTTLDGGDTWTLSSRNIPRNISADCDINSDRTDELDLLTLDGVINKVTATATVNTNTRHSWYALDNGEIISASDDWKTTQFSFSPGRTARLAMWFSDAKNGWAVGVHPAFTRTLDGGNTWTIVSYPLQYSRYPAPWFWASLLLISWMWMRMLQTKAPPVEDGVAAIAASDAPTQDFSQDRLHFAPLAKGISRFIRNEATEPPLTLAITGDWGTGKSSLMSLICKDLKDCGSRPVWFNAWHHQKDEQLLAALLNAVREQSLPTLLELNGWLFRWRLLLLRIKNHWFIASLLIMVGVWLTAYLSTYEANQWQSLWTIINKTSTALQQGFTPAYFESINLGPSAAKLAALTTAFVVLRKTLTAFGADPAVLLSNSVDQFRLKEANALTGFRSKFAKEFNEVTQCLPERMVIVIDDLDRCRAEAVLEVMETVNFLVSSGKCFVIFGMATNRVQAALALSFEKIAQEMTELDISAQATLTAEVKAEMERLRRRKYARDYLEKLINLEIAVPNTPIDTPHRLMESFSTPATRQTVQINRLKKAVVAAFCVGVLAWIWHLGEQYQLPVFLTVAQAPTPVKTTPVTPSTVTTETEEIDLTLPKVNLKSGEGANPYTSIEAINTRNDVAVYVVTITLLVIAAGVAYALLSLRQSLYTVQDSTAFKDALKAWSPLVQRHRKTPRALKRFANRLRYLAMLQQAQRLDQLGWDAIPYRFKHWLGLSVTPEQDSVVENSIAEHRIVALGALYEVFGSDWKNCAKASLPDNELAEVAEQSIRTYCTQNPGVTWPPTEEEILCFAKSLAGVRIPS
jgi:photosystem II stability/assembly factor-like uncharacterized protein